MNRIYQQLLLCVGCLLALNVQTAKGWSSGTERELTATIGAKNEPVEGRCFILDGTYNAGIANNPIGEMTSKGFKLRTNQNNNRAVFTVKAGYVITRFVGTGISNYANVVDAEGDWNVLVTRVEVDGEEVPYLGGAFPDKWADHSATLTINNICARKSIAIYFDNSNSQGNQIRFCYAIDWETTDLVLTTYEGKELYAYEGADATCFIKNPNFDNASNTGWQGDAPGMCGDGNHCAANVAEHYNKTFDTYQELSGLPDGLYMLRAKTAFRGSFDDYQNNVPSAAVLYGHSNGVGTETPFNNMWLNIGQSGGDTYFGTPAEELAQEVNGEPYHAPNDPSAFRIYSEMGYYDTFLYFPVTGGTARIGVRNLAKHDDCDNWACFDSFKLTYFGENYYQGEYNWRELLTNNFLEDNDMRCFYAKEYPSEDIGEAKVYDGVGVNGGRSIRVTSGSYANNDYDTQFWIRLPEALPKGKKVKVSFDYKATYNETINTEIHNEPGQYICWSPIGDVSFTKNWQHFETEITVPDECDGTQSENGYLKEFRSIAFNLAKDKNRNVSFYFDNIMVKVESKHFDEKEFTNGKLKYRTNSEATVEVIGHEEITATTLTVPLYVIYDGKSYTVTAIGQQGLVGLGSVKILNLPHTIQKFGYQAFIYGAFGSIKIPASVTTIEDQAFNFCENLTTINVDAGNESFCAVGGVLFSKDQKMLYCYPQAKAGDSYEIPNTVETICTSAFRDNKNLKILTIPESVIDYWWQPFEGCSNLSAIICRSTNPREFGDNLFDVSTYEKATLYVPSGALATYRAKTPWNKFKNMRTIPSQITVTAKSYEISYGDDLPAFGYDVSSNLVTGTPTITCNAKKGSDAGTYDIVISEGSLISYVPLVFATGKLTIKKVPLTVSVGNYTKVQGAAMPTFKLTYSGFKNGDTEAKLTRKPTATCSATATSAPGTYNITLSGGSSPNYNFTYKNGTLTVTKADAIVITAKSYTINYGDPIPTLGYTVSGGTMSGKPTLSCSAGAVGSKPGAGVYDIVVSKGTVTNYDPAFVNGTLTVQKVPLTAKVGNYTKYVGDDMPDFEITYSGFKNGETKAVLTKQPEISCEATKWSPAGTYPITLSGGEAANYDFTYQGGTLTVKDFFGISLQSMGHGAIIYGGNRVTNYQRFEVKQDVSIILTFAPDEGYELSQLMVNGYDVTSNVQNNSYVTGKVTKEMQVIATFTEASNTFRVGSINYATVSIPEKTVVVDKATSIYSYAGHMTVPETVSYGGSEWTVVGVVNNAFYNSRRLNTISLPQTLRNENMGISLFTGCTNLAAITWNAPFSLSASMMGTVGNPNLLFYTNNRAFAPSTVTNVIVKGVASHIELQDVMTTEDNFYCPTAFTAEEISYSHNYAMESGYGGVGGWETLALPFTVQKITHERAGNIVPFAAYDGANYLPFWLYAYSSAGFVRASRIEANVPYIICMPNNSEYDSEFLLPGKVTFSSQNVVVPETSSSSPNDHPSRGDKTFIAAYKSSSRSKGADIYPMNVVNDLYAETGGYTPGSVFKSNLRNVATFEAIMISSSSASRGIIDIEFADPTAIDNIVLSHDGRYSVYNLNGQLLIQTDNATEWSRLMRQLPAGVYIINGQKTIIK